MSPIRQHVPRAGIDPIDGAGPALAMFGLLIAEPRRPQTIALLLDAGQCGLGAFVVEGTVQPDSVIDVARLLADAAEQHPSLQAVVLASVRTEPTTPDALLDDVDRWVDIDEVLAEADVELIEWFVIGDDPPVSCPRDLLGAPARW